MAAFATVAGCRDYGSPASAYQNWKDQIAVATGLRDLGLVWPCTVKEGDSKFGAVYGSIPLDQCYKMEPLRRWTGLWRDEFEGSRFCPAPATECRIDSPGDIIWLDADRVTRKEPDGALYAIDMLGRRTAVRGSYGHMGGSDHELIVDRFISIKRVGNPLTDAENEAALKQCESGTRCTTLDK
jgi:hypothetical protein